MKWIPVCGGCWRHFKYGTAIQHDCQIFAEFARHALLLRCSTLPCQILCQAAAEEHFLFSFWELRGDLKKGSVVRMTFISSLFNIEWMPSFLQRCEVSVTSIYGDSRLQWDSFCNPRLAIHIVKDERIEKQSLTLTLLPLTVTAADCMLCK